MRETTAAWRPRGGLGSSESTPSTRKPDAEPVSGGLEVDVAGGGVVGLADQQIDEADDWRLVGQVAHVRGAVGLGVGRVAGAGAEVADELDDGFRRRKGPADRLLQHSVVDFGKLGGGAVVPLEIRDGLGVGRSWRNRDPKAAAGHGQREHSVVLQILGRECLGHPQSGFGRRARHDLSAGELAVCRACRVPPGGWR